METPPTYKEVSRKISIGNPTDTRILTITVTDPDPKMAKITADAVADEASEYIGDIMEMIPPKVIEYGQVATEKTSPSNSKNAMLGAMLGLVLTCGIITLQTILNEHGADRRRRRKVPGADGVSFCTHEKRRGRIWCKI